MAGDRGDAMLFNLPVHVDGLKSTLSYVNQTDTSCLDNNIDYINYNLDELIWHRRSFRTR